MFTDNMKVIVYSNAMTEFKSSKCLPIEAICRIPRGVGLELTNRSKIST